MRHARGTTPLRDDGTAPSGPGRLVLPLVLATATCAAFAGLATVSAAAQSDRLVAEDAVPAARPLDLRAAPVPVERTEDVDRASRSRPRPPSPSPAPPPPAPVAPAEVAPPPPPPSPKPKPSPKPTPTATRAPKPAAQAPVSSSGGTCPVPAATFTDTYGAPRSGGRSHLGTDLLAPYGSPVYAVTAGVVDTTSSSNGGISLYLRAANGERYFYAHNSANVAGDGQRVAAGDLIARVGSTGNAGEINHVHFEREVGGSSVNPYRFVLGLCR